MRLEQISKGTFQVNAGSLFPAFRRLERDGLIKGEWQTTENNRRAKWYRLTVDGEKRLKEQARDWATQTSAISAILNARLSDL